MSQHDFTIANQGFPAFRADLNDFLTAVKTTHSGTSTPSGAVAGTIWLDTTSASQPVLKYYDGADNITLATIDHTTNTVNFTDSALDLITDTTPQLGGNLDVNGNSIVSTSNANITLAPNGTGQIIVNAGAVGTPTIAPTGDTNTGIFFPSADTIAFTEGGTEAMRIDSSGNVGIGTTTPKEKLDNRGAGVFSGDNTTATNGFGTASGLLLSTAGDNSVARITAVSNGNNSVGLSLRSLSSGSAVEGMRIDSSGNLQFNSGYGSVATAFGCRAWVNFNGTGTVAIRGSGNVSSITDRGLGLYTINFTNALADSNYAFSASTKTGVTTNPTSVSYQGGQAYSTTALGIASFEGANLSTDYDTITIAVFR